MALFRLMFTKVNASAHVRNDANRISASRSRKDCKLDTLDTLISIYKYEIIIIIGKSDKENDCKIWSNKNQNIFSYGNSIKF